MQRNIKIQVDHREKASATYELLLQTRFEIELCHLQWGDYRINDLILVERKEAADQARGLKSCAGRPVFLLEGNPCNTGFCIDRRAVRGALISLQTLWHLPVVRSRDPSETVEILTIIVNQNFRCEEGLPRPGYRPRRLLTRQLYFLQGLPGIGPVRARQLLECFGTVSGVLQAPVEALAKVPGIGDDTAAKIRRVLDTDVGFSNGSGKIQPISVLADNVNT